MLLTLDDIMESDDISLRTLLAIALHAMALLAVHTLVPAREEPGRPHED